MFVIRNRNIFFVIAALLVLGSIAAISLWGLRPGVDFTGGAVIEVEYATSTAPSADQISSALSVAGFEGSLVRTAGSEHEWNIRTRPLAEGESERIVDALSDLAGPTTSSTSIGARMDVERLSSVGPTVGQELRRKTAIAIVLVVLMTILYIAFTFRGVAKPVSSWIYGLVAIVTLIHDIIIPTGVFAILGHYAGLEADTLFVVALLTILGVSINDTIVVFDRIRENLRFNEEQKSKEPFDVTVGKSLEQTYVRSFNTSFTVILVLLVLFFLGGPTIHSFILTLLVGQIAGTYSSLFIASPMLVAIGNRKAR